MNFIEILKTYYYIIFEDAKFIQNGSYKDIIFYFSDIHIKQRNNERYFGEINFRSLKLIISRFLKELIQENFFNSYIKNEKSFTIHTLKSNIWICGRLKKNFGKWRIEIFTLLPSNNPTFNKNDMFREINI